MPAVEVGDTVGTPLGKGVVCEVRKNGRLLVLIGERRLVVEAGSARVVDRPVKAAGKRQPAATGETAAPHPDAGTHRAAPDLDLHGVVVAEALDRVLSAINAAILAGHGRLRVIHGRSGGKLRAALHGALRRVPSVRAFRLDPANDGVTIVEL